MFPKIHVCVMNASPHVFGAEKSMVYLMQMLDQHQVRFSGITGGGATDGLFHQVHDIETIFCEFRQLSVSAGLGKMWNQYTSWRQARQRLHNILVMMRPDVVHANGIQSMVYLLGEPRTKARIIWHVRDRFRGRWFENACARRADAILVPAKAMIDDLKTFSAKCQVCLNPIGSEFTVRPNALGSAEARAEISRIRIGFFGQLIPRKGCHVLLAALSTVFKQLPKIEAHIYGDDLFCPSSPYVKEIHRTVEIMNKEGGNISLKGYVSDIRKAYHDVEVVVIPSLGEPFGRVAHEAMSLGKTVIASRVGGLAESVADRCDGLLVEANDPEALARAIIEAVECQDLRRQLGAAGCQKALEYNVRVQQSAKDIFNLYEKLAKRTSPSCVR